MLAGAAEETERVLAAEIGGWIPHYEPLPWLACLASDSGRAVETAALDALYRRAAGAAAAELMAVLPTLARPAQWAGVRALIDLVDPHLLMHKGDPLDIRPMLAVMPKQFGIEAQRIIDRRRQDVDQEAEREGEREFGE